MGYIKLFEVGLKGIFSKFSKLNILNFMFCYRYEQIYFFFLCGICKVFI